jgi:hypothetical protein
LLAVRLPEFERRLEVELLVVDRTLSTASTCAASAALSARLGSTSAALDRTSLTETPSRRRKLRKRSALRSDGVTGRGSG